MTPEKQAARRAALLDARDKMLAARGLGARPAGAPLRVLCFTLATEVYALPLGDVARIVPFQRAAKVPRAHPAVLGLIGVGARTYSLIDLAALLGAPAQGPGAGNVILLRHITPPVGLLCTEVLAALEANEIPAPQTPGRDSIASSHVQARAMGKFSGRSMPLLNLADLISPLALSLGETRS